MFFFMFGVIQIPISYIMYIYNGVSQKKDNNIFIRVLKYVNT